MIIGGTALPCLAPGEEQNVVNMLRVLLQPVPQSSSLWHAVFHDNREKKQWRRAGKKKTVWGKRGRAVVLMHVWG